MQYVALLRGINVGGNNLIKMPDLKACFEAQGYTNVATYIQSGNVLFETNKANQATLTKEIEQALAKTFDYYAAKVVLCSRPQLQKVVDDAPKIFHHTPASDYRCDVIFLKEPLTVDQTLQAITLKEGVDSVAPGEKVVYFARLAERAAQSRLTRIIGTPIYQDMTIRNWNTTQKLLQKMQELEAHK
jgi:uncharacterized protein (DUF1697 family)